MTNVIHIVYTYQSRRRLSDDCSPRVVVAEFVFAANARIRYTRFKIINKASSRRTRSPHKNVFRSKSCGVVLRLALLPQKYTSK